MSHQFVPFLAREILYSGHLQSLGAAGIVYVAAQNLSAPIDLRHLLSVYLVFQAIYYFDRYRGLSHDASTNVSRTQHIRIYARFIPVIDVILLALALVAAINQPLAVATLAIIAILGFLYPLLFKGITAFIPMFKNFYVAVVFALLVLIPYVFTGSWPQHGVIIWPLLIFIFIQTLVMQVLLDVKDARSDNQQSLRTLPILFGRRRTIIFALCLTVISALALVGYAQMYQLPGLFILSLGSLLLDLLTYIAIGLGRPFAYFMVTTKYLIWPLFYV